MTRRKLSIAILLGPVLCLAAIRPASGSPQGQAPDLGSLSDDDLKTVTVRLDRSRCYGTCPAYSITIHGDGRVEYDGKSNVKEKGAQEGRVEPAAIKALMSEFANAKFFSLAEDYSEKCTRYCTDMPTVATELDVKGMAHRVKHYYGCGGAPKELFELESTVDKSANSERWTGDVSKQGPFGTTCIDR